MILIKTNCTWFLIYISKLNLSTSILDAYKLKLLFNIEFAIVIGLSFYYTE